MKKVLAVFTVLVLIALAFNLNIVNATDNETTASVNLSYQATKQNNQIIFSIHLGDFQGITENSPMKATATLDFDTNQVDTIKGEAYEGWNVTVSAATKTVEFTTDSATPNVEMGKIIFNLKTSSVTETTNGKVAIDKFTITNDNNLNETYPRSEMEYTLVPGTQNPGGETPGDNNPGENPSTDTNTVVPDQNIIINTDTNTTDGNDVQVNNVQTNNFVDNTIITDNKLPQTGMNIAITLGALAIFVLAIVGIVKYKTNNINKK